MTSATITKGAPPRQLRCRDLVIPLDGVPRIMGILNITSDSFSDGGRYLDPAAALAHARRLIAEGADILDIGAQSTRPGYTEISDEEEIARVVPLIRTLVADPATATTPLSIDTYKPAVARAALEAGAHLLNDIHGLQGAPELAALAAAHGAAVVAMHNDPALATLPPDADPLPPVLAWFETTLAIAARAGLPREQVVLDPGIGFGKTQAQNLALIARAGELRTRFPQNPVLMAASRKSVIDHVLHLPPGERLEGTLAITTLAAWQRIDIVRVHDVTANLRAARMAAALRAASMTN